MKPNSVNNWYEVKSHHQIDSPTLLVFPDRVKHNIRTAIGMVGDVKRLRPHVKTSKSPDAVKLMQEAGINKFKCATISEAEMLGIIKANDVLLAYQPTGPKLQRFIELIKKYPDTEFSCLSDSMTTAKEQTAAFQKARIQVSVYIDINVGMNRTGITPGPAVIELLKYLSESDVIKVVGFHVYDGHLRNPDIIVREQESNDCFRLVENLLEQIKNLGWSAPPIIAGGSPTFPIHARRKNIECSPGTFVYWDKGYSDNCAEQDFLPAVVLMTRIISVTGNNMFTNDLGHKSVAAENEITRRVFFLNEIGLTPVSQSEEHLVLKNESDKLYSVGDILYGLPFHVCPTVALYERMIVIENGEPSGEWKNIARDRKITV